MPPVNAIGVVAQSVKGFQPPNKAGRT